MPTRIVIVEEEREVGAALSERLRALGCEVWWVTHGEDCFDVASREHPHMIVIADVLGAASGLNVCNGLKRDAELRHIPVVVMSAGPREALTDHMALVTCADAYVQKSEAMEEVVEQVEYVVARGEPFERARRGPPPSSRRGIDGLVESAPEETFAQVEERLALLLSVAPASVSECDTLEVVAPPPSEVEAMSGPASESPISLLSSSLPGDESTGELRDEVARLTGLLEAQAAYIAKLEDERDALRDELAARDDA